MSEFVLPEKVVKTIFPESALQQPVGPTDSFRLEDVMSAGDPNPSKPYKHDDEPLDDENRRTFPYGDQARDVSG